MDYLVYKNFLAHHGIDGQKWGVRNGPPYPLSKSTHNKVVTKSKDSSVHKQKTSKDISSNYWSPDYKKAVTNKEEMKRAKNAADTGLKALHRMGRNIGDFDPNHITGLDREWFLFEDQTIGLPMIADLANQGYTSKEISDFVDKIESAYEDDRKNIDAYSEPYFSILEGNRKDGYLKEFADACEKEIKRGTKS